MFHHGHSTQRHAIYLRPWLGEVVLIVGARNGQRKLIACRYDDAGWPYLNIELVFSSGLQRLCTVMSVVGPIRKASYPGRAYGVTRATIPETRGSLDPPRH